MNTSRCAAAVFAAVFSLMLAAAAAAQPAAPPADPARQTERALAGHRLAQLARNVLNEPEPTHPARLAVAAAMLDEALAMNADNPELWRLKLELAELRGDAAGVREALTSYLRLEPRDDVAQLRLIDLLAADQQTVEERLNVYQRLVQGAGAQRLSAPLRSRVAMRAARLAREQGDVPRYGELLKQAIALDAANPDAAMEAYLFLQQRGVGPAELANALFNLLAARPADGDVQARVAAMLLQCGHYQQAVSWYESASRIWNLGQSPPPEDLLAIAHDWALAMWGAGRGGEALAFIDSFVGGIGAEARMPVTLATLKVAIHKSLGNAEQAAAAFAELSQTLAERGEADAANAQLLADRIWAHLLLNESVEKTDEMLARLEQILPADDTAVQRLRGWRLMRAGDAAAANVLEKCADRDLACRLGLALATGDTGDARQRRIELLQEVAGAAAGRLIGLMASSELQRMDARAQPSGECLQIGRMAAQLPPELRQAGTHPMRFALLRVQPVKSTVQYGEPVQVRIELTNTSPVPLSLGAGGAIPSDVLLSPELRVGPQRTDLPPQMVDMARRLRLDRNESVVVTTTIDQGVLAQALWRNPGQTFTVGLSAVLNPVLRGQAVEPGVLGSRTVSAAITRASWPVKREDLPRYYEMLTGADTTEAMGSAALLARLATGALEADPALAREIAGRVNAAYEQGQTARRVWILTHAGGRGADVLFAPMVRSAVASDEPAVQYAVLTSQAARPDDPVLTAALRRDPGPIRKFAEAWQQVLQLVQARK